MDSLQKAVEILNFILEREPKALQKLIETKVKITNEEVIEHPDIQVAEDKPGTVTMSLLGILNGIVGSKKGKVASYLDDDTDKIQKFGIFKK